MKPTAAQIEGVIQEYSRIAQEPITVEFIGGWFYIFGSELACLRIFYKQRQCKTAKVEYSQNLSTWAYSQALPPGAFS
jgi:hypothetical protein